MLKVEVPSSPMKGCIRMNKMNHPANELLKVKATEKPGCKLGQEFRKNNMMRD